MTTDQPDPTPEEPARTRFAEPPALPDEAPDAAPDAAASAPVEPPPAAPEQTPEPTVVPPPPVPLASPVSMEPPAPEAWSDPVPGVDLADEADEADEGPKPPRKGLLRLLAGLAVLLLVAVIALGVLAVRTSGQAPEEKDRKAALTAGMSAAKLVFSYDYRHLPQDFEKGRAVTTGGFRSEYDKTTKEVVSDVAPRYKTVVVADVSEGGVVRSSDDTVTLLLFVNQSSTSTLSKSPKLTQSRVQMVMTRTGGTWRVSKITAL